MQVGEKVMWKRGRHEHQGTILAFLPALIGSKATVRCLEGRYHTLHVRRLTCLEAVDSRLDKIESQLDTVKRLFVTEERHERDFANVAVAISQISEQLRTTGRRA